MSDLDAATLDPRGLAGPAPTTPRVAVTVLWHPDVTRVGQRAWLDGRLRIARAEPAFGPVDGGPAEVLADPYLSRRPLTLELSSGSVRLTPGGSPLELDGAPVTAPVELTPAQLAVGAVLLVAERVALVVHHGEPEARVEHADGLVGASPSVHAARAAIARFAASDLPVLIGGPSGTGKELVAAALHARGRRAGGPFVAVNMAAVPASTAAAELFGHARGAFTGAAEARPGYFGAADGGTLFLDEIGDTPAAVQPMLLRALEARARQPVGAAGAVPVDVRLVAASELDLGVEVAAGRFRPALLHRLATLRVDLAPLAARREDIGRLLRHFLMAALGALGCADRLGREPPWLLARVVAQLACAPWPGNVRQLRNVAQRLALLGDEPVRAAGSGLPSAARSATPGDAPADIEAALAACGWSVRAAAERLGMPRTTLNRWLDRHPTLRRARDITDAEVRAALEDCGGDEVAASERLRISARALRQRAARLS